MPRTKPLPWQTASFLFTIVPGLDNKRGLFVYVAGEDDNWLAVAVEGPRDRGPQALLGDHAHQLIGEFANLAAAQRAAEGFARRWLRGKKIGECGCEDIAPGRRRLVRRVSGSGRRTAPTISAS